MSIELTIILSVISVSCAVFFGIKGQKRSEKAETRKEAVDMTTVIVKLENIGAGITEIKSELRNVKDDVKENRERLIKVEASAAQAHKRIDVYDRSRAAAKEG